MSPEHSVTSLIRGPVAYHGELWIDKHHKGCFEIFTRIGMLLALGEVAAGSVVGARQQGDGDARPFGPHRAMSISRELPALEWEPIGADRPNGSASPTRRHLEF